MLCYVKVEWNIVKLRWGLLAYFRVSMDQD